jgi:aminopeptidase N
MMRQRRFGLIDISLVTKMQKLFACLCLAVFLHVGVAAAEEPFRAAADRPVDITHIRLNVDVSLKKKQLAGTATIDLIPLRPVRTIQFDAIDFEVSGVTASRADSEQQLTLPFDNTGKKLILTFPEQLAMGSRWRVEISYRVRDPKTGLHFFGPSKTEPDVPWMAWTQGEAESNRYWFPCFDHPNERQTTEIIATVDSRFEVLSNGTQISKEKQPEGKIRCHWSQQKPHVAYLVTLVVGEFAIGRDEWRGKPVLYYAPPDRAADIDRTFGRTKEMLDFFSDRFGIEYPWPKYAQVVVEQFTAGGMENTSATTLNQMVMHDERAMLDGSPDWLIAHELGHQWWGDLVTCKDWSHLWLNEGFATYCEVMWAEHKEGTDVRDYRLLEKSRSARSGPALKRPIVDRQYSSPGSMFDSRAYPKGGWVLHMLRRRVGDDAFFQALQRYGTVYGYQTVETSDIRKSMERLLGISLERFFYDWTERPGHPELTVKTTYDAADGLARISIAQTQKADAFHFPLAIEIHCDGSDQPVTITKRITEKSLTMYVPVPGRPKLVRVDPEFSLLCSLKEEKSRKLWAAQLTAPTVAERVRALEHFAESKTDADRELVRGVLESDSFYGVRVEAAKSLARSGGNVSRDALIAALKQPEARVRAASVAGLGKFVGDETVTRELTQRLKKGDRSYKVEAALLSSLTAAAKSAPIDVLLASLNKPSHRDVIRTAALRSLGTIPTEQTLKTLGEWSTPGHPRACRIAAIASLAKCVKNSNFTTANQQQTLEQLLGFTVGDRPRIRRAAVTAIANFGPLAESARAKLIAIAEHDADRRTRLAAESAIKKLDQNAPSKGDIAKLRKELDALRKRNVELENRLKKLEAK